MRTRRIAPPPADLLVVDECHHAPARTWQKIIASYPGVPLIGLTATPCRADGRGLGGIFDAIVECPQVAELIDQKYLVRTRTYAPVDPDLKGVQTRVGDYVETQLAERMDALISSATSSAIGIVTESIGGPWPSPSTCRTRSTSAKSSPGRE